MKRIVFLSMFVLIPILIYAQGETAPPVEIFCVTEGLPSSPVMTFTMTAHSERWDVTSNASYPPQTEHYFLTNDYEEETYIPTGNNLGQNSAGFEFVGFANAGYPTVALGLYKFTNNLNGKYFYLDYRDFRAIHYVYYQPNDSTWQNSIDIWIRYNNNLSRFEYNGKGIMEDFLPITNGQLLNIWGIKQKGTQKTSLFPDYWENCLGLIDDGNDHPKIVWGPFPNDDFSVSYYKIYKKKGIQNFALYATTTNTEYIDTEETLLFGPPVANETIAKYRVTAFGILRSSSIETDPSNEVEARIEGNAPE